MEIFVRSAADKYGFIWLQVPDDREIFGCKLENTVNLSEKGTILNIIKGRLAILHIVNHYRAYIFDTSPQLRAGDKFWTLTAPRSNILSPAHNSGLVKNICSVIFNNKLYIVMSKYKKKCQNIKKFKYSNCVGSENSRLCFCMFAAFSEMFTH